MFKGAGFLILDSPFPAGRFRSVLSSRGVFRMEEKSAPFTKTVKSAAPENSTHTQNLAHPPFESAIPDTI
jgi:hypothetical protein